MTKSRNVCESGEINLLRVLTAVVLYRISGIGVRKPGHWIDCERQDLVDEPLGTT